MSDQNQSNSAALLLFLIILAAVAFWYFGRTRPIEVRSQSQRDNHQVQCHNCRGSGKVECPNCGGFGSIDAMESCLACKGTGKIKMKFGPNPAEARCTKCRGSGKIEARAKCPACEGAGNTQCPVCNGTGKIWSSSTNNSNWVVMAYSPWERLLLFMRLPIEQNPCPQRDAQGGYPIVEKYIAIRSEKQGGRVKKWGEFNQNGYPWKMTAEVEFHNKSGQTYSKTIEFIVQNRALAKSQVVK